MAPRTTTMKRLNVSSREYKVMLRHKRFRGNERVLLKAAHDFWREFSRRIAGIALETRGDLKAIKPPRLITFHDTAKAHLNRESYIFRERDTTGGKREVTLKFRHNDRHVAQGRSMKVRS